MSESTMVSRVMIWRQDGNSVQHDEVAGAGSNFGCLFSLFAFVWVAAGENLLCECLIIEVSIFCLWK